MIEETKGYTLSVDTYKKAKALGMKDPLDCINQGLARVVVGGESSTPLMATVTLRKSKGITWLALGSHISFSIQRFQIPMSPLI